MQTEQIPSNQDLQNMVKALQAGPTFSEINKMDNEILEDLYGLAYNFYTAKDYKSAEIIFKALCFYKHNDYRFWMGLAGSKQAIEDYAGAIDAYNFAGLSDNLNNPIPFFYLGHCYLRLGLKENAISVLSGLMDIGDKKNEEYNKYKKKAEELLMTINKVDA